MNILVTGGSGLIGSCIMKHLSDTYHGVINYDLKELPGYYWWDAKEPLTGHAFPILDAFIDCARYDCQSRQVLNWSEVIRRFKEQGKGGKIILFSSIYGHKAPRFDIYPGTEIPETPLEYAMDKGAIEQAVRYLAEKHKGDMIQVNAIAPGGVVDAHSTAFLQNYLCAGKVPMIYPKSILPTIDMLLSKDNAVNGQTLTVSNGWEL